MIHATGWFVSLSTGLFFLALLIWTVMAGQVAKRSTVSSWLLDTWRRYPVIPLIVGMVLGVLFGHWAWPQYR